MYQHKITKSHQRFAKKISQAKVTDQTYLTELHLIFENCESFTIPVHYIHGITLEGITENLWLQDDFGDGVTQSDPSESAKFAVLEVSADFLKQNVVDEAYDWRPQDGKKRESIYERIVQGRDVTHFGLTFSNGAYREIDLPWKSADRNSTFNKRLQIREVTGYSNDVSTLILIFSKKKLGK